MKELIKRAQMLGSRIDTEWSESHEYVYEEFAEKLEAMYNCGKITATEYNEVAGVAFYDYEPK